MRRLLHRDDYTIGWVCALPVELAAAQEMLDEEHDDLGILDENLYVLGSIGPHNVAIVCLPAGQIGNNPAVAVATQMQATFRGIRFGLMVGIGGGVPSAEADIRLGDVVVSQPHRTYAGVVQYDTGKSTPTGFERTGSLNSPPRILLSAVARVEANKLRGRSRLFEYVSQFSRIPKFRRSEAGPDVLFDATYNHQGGKTCDLCSTSRQEAREPRSSEEEAAEQEGGRRRENVVVHYGTIASGNQVMRNALERDKVSTELGGVLCFEMEAAGLMNNFPCLVIRGICDYADSHKNKKWQAYAAATAAAYAKEVLSIVPSTRPPPTDIDVTKTCTVGAVPYNKNSRDLEGSELSRRTTTANGSSLQVESSSSTRPPKIANSLVSMLSDEQRKEMMDMLQFKQRDARLLTLKLAQAKTCRWLLKNEQYRDWVNADKLVEHRGFFWIKGKPGAGKSVMMKFLFSEAKNMKTMKGCLIISFFFNARGEALEKSTSGLYRALILQLLEKAPETCSVFDSYSLSEFEAIKDTGWQNSWLRDLFIRALEALGGNHRIVCYVDALDECPEEDIRDMISFFEDLGELEEIGEFRVCFSSRHYPEISIRTGLQLALESEQEHANDITLYIDKHLKVGDSSQAEDVKAEIVRKASGIFLWVNLIIPILNKEYDRGRIKALKKRLAEIPAGLHDLFLDMLTRDDNNMDYLLVCVQVLLFAARPLTPEEFRTAVEINCETTTDDPSFGQQLDDDISSNNLNADNLRKFVLDVSKGLADITQSKEPTVQFIHESVRDFLLKTGGINKLQPVAGNPEGLGHNTLKRICALRISSFYNDMTKNYRDPDASQYNVVSGTYDHGYYLWDPTTYIESPKHYSLIQYAKDYIFHHANLAQKKTLDQTLFLKDFDTRSYAFACGSSRSHILYLLAQNGSNSLIRIHPERGNHFQIREGRYKYPLLGALFAGQRNAARALLSLPSLPEKELDITHKPSTLKADSYKSKRSILSYLCEFGDADILRAVLRSGPFDIDATLGKECLEYASSEAIVDAIAEFELCTMTYIHSADDFDIAPAAPYNETPPLPDPNLTHLKSALMRHPSIINADQIWGSSKNLLDYAAAKGFVQIAMLCVKDTTTANREDAFLSAICGRNNSNGRVSIIELLIREGGGIALNSDDFKTKITTLLFNIICHPHNEDVVTLILTKSLWNPEAKNPNGFTLLAWAIQKGRKSYVKLFLSAGSNPMAICKDSNTPLTLAVKLSDLSSFHCLVEHDKCDANAKDKKGQTALSWCAAVADNCAIEMVKCLLDRPEVDPNCKEPSGRTALMRAVESGNPKLVKALLCFDSIDPDLGSCRLSTPLRLAFDLYLESKSQVFWEISRLLLLTFKVNPDNRQKLPTPAEIAHNFGLVQFVKLLEVFHRCRIAQESGSSQYYEQELKDLTWSSSI